MRRCAEGGQRGGGDPGGGSNKIAIEDKAERERILMHVPSQKLYIRMEMPNNQPPVVGPPKPPPPGSRLRQRI